VSWPDACTVTFGHGQGEDGMGPCACIEVWALDHGARVTFGGFPPRGNRQWRSEIWRAIAAEATARSEEESGQRAVGQRAQSPVS
jgi:hypothetical protein